jgi:glutamate/tyrosine decarboxylase-like PLP-dependent enzyme
MRERGTAAADVLAELDRRRATEPEVHGGRLFGLTYPSGRTDLEALAHSVNERYLFGNALNPFKFPELAALEGEVVAMVGSLVHVPGIDRPEGGGGSMTSGGTESILMSMLVSRERARARGIERPQILAPFSAHPAYAKAAHYFDLDFVSIPLDDAYRADLREAERLIGPQTAVVVASAFSYPHGVMDPVTELAALAAANGAGCHVDACIGGFVLPFLERLGRDVPPWDFRVPGVTEMSADVHKYGYVPKGASVVLHRDNDWFGHQAFLYDRWPAGLYGSPAIAGARPAAPIATAWAVMTYLGSEGYDAIVRDLMATVDTVRAGVAAIGGIDVVGEPIGPVLAFRSDTIDLAAVADVMDARGWNLNRNNDPPGLHLMLSPAHAAVVDQLLVDLADAVAHHGESKGIEVWYS